MQHIKCFRQQTNPDRVRTQENSNFDRAMKFYTALAVLGWIVAARMI